jgi:uncharacterized protein
MRALVLADTHIRSSAAVSTRRLPPEVYAALRRADVVLHAGDVVVPDLLEELATYAPVHTVLGNNDHALVGALPETLELDLDGVNVAMVHDSGARQGRAARMKRRFPDAAIVVYGHSHLPEDAFGVDGQRLFNPGSPTERRRAPTRTYGVLDLIGGRIRRRRIVPIPADR